LTGAIRVANGITDSTGLGMTSSDVDSFGNIGVDTASGITYTPTGNHDAQLTSNGVTFAVNGIRVDHNRVATVFAYGTIGTGTQGAFFVQESLDAPADGQSKMQPVHAALQASATALSLDFYFVKPGVCATAIAGATPNVSATFNATAATVALAGGTYEICVTDAGGTVLFDSGPTGITLPASSSVNVFQLAAFDAPSGKGNGSTLVLSLLDNDGGNRILYNLEH
jgi:Domain of unknown function (DUF4397)